MQKYVIEQQMQIYIYGVGRVGRLMENLLVEKGFSVTAFIDVNAASRHYKNYEIIKPDELIEVARRNAVIIVALAGKYNAQMAKETLVTFGYKNVIVYSDKRLQEQLCLMDEKITCAHCVFAAVCQLDKAEDVSKIHMVDLTISLTTKCALNCKNCVALVPELKEKRVVRTLKPADFEEALKVLGEYVDTINEYALAGGEPLLNKEIGRIIDVIKKSAINFKRIRIITSATVPIPEEFMEWLKDRRIIVTIDDYGDKTGERARRIIQNNIENLEKNECNYEILNNSDGIWYDFGNFEDRKLSEAEITERFEKCNMKDCIVLSPVCYMGRCGRHMTRVSMLGGISEDGKREYIDLLNDGEMVKSELIEMMEGKMLRACNYCNGNSVEHMVNAGEQV